MTENTEHWDVVIDASKKSNSLSIKDLWQYRDLLLLFVKRDFIASFKQTILGPIWFVIKPLFQAFVIFFVFGRIAKFQPEGVDGMSFYLGGVLCWTFFATTLTLTSNTFTLNKSIFGKVYFPRLIAPLSIMLSSGLKMLVQLLLFLVIFLWAYFSKGDGQITWKILLTPLIMVHIGVLSLGIGLFISSLTTKYRDLKFLLEFGIQLAMYASTVPYPLSKIEEMGSKFELAVLSNPMSGIIEFFRYIYMGSAAGSLDLAVYGYSVIFTIIIFILGIRIFNRVEKNFMDTV